jgi:hypothetical protein
MIPGSSRNILPLPASQLVLTGRPAMLLLPMMAFRVAVFVMMPVMRGSSVRVLRLFRPC